MKTPMFWYNGQSLLKTLLSPLGGIYNKIVQWRFSHAQPFHASRPVICVGNLTMGGGGKTPVILGLTQAFHDRGLKPHIVSRGYGGRLKGPAQVDRHHHGVRDVGDEPLLHAERAPTWISHDRVKGLEAATQDHPSLILVDDGFQNPTFHKDFSLVLIDGPTGLGNGAIFPAGPLREDALQGLARAHAIFVLDEPSCTVQKLLHQVRVPIFYGTRRRILPSLDERPITAFTGIALPQRFFEGLPCQDNVAFPDHHLFSKAELRKLKKRGTRLWTTTKDYVRLPLSFRPHVEIVGLTIDIPSPLIDLILKTSMSPS